MSSASNIENGDHSSCFHLWYFSVCVYIWFLYSWPSCIFVLVVCVLMLCYAAWWPQIENTMQAYLSLHVLKILSTLAAKVPDALFLNELFWPGQLPFLGSNSILAAVHLTVVNNFKTHAWLLKRLFLLILLLIPFYTCVDLTSDTILYICGICVHTDAFVYAQICGLFHFC